jgi:hypothetical protein
MDSLPGITRAARENSSPNATGCCPRVQCVLTLSRRLCAAVSSSPYRQAGRATTASHREPPLSHAVPSGALSIWSCSLGGWTFWAELVQPIAGGQRQRDDAEREELDNERTGGGSEPLQQDDHEAEAERGES